MSHASFFPFYEHLTYQIASLTVFSHNSVFTLAALFPVSAVHTKPSHWPWASLPASPYKCMLFVNFSFQCFLDCARKILIFALNDLSKKNHLQSQILLLHSPFSKQLSGCDYGTFVLPLFIKSASAHWMFFWASNNSCLPVLHVWHTVEWQSFTVVRALFWYR